MCFKIDWGLYATLRRLSSRYEHKRRSSLAMKHSGSLEDTDKKKISVLLRFLVIYWGMGRNIPRQGVGRVEHIGGWSGQVSTKNNDS